MCKLLILTLITLNIFGGNVKGHSYHLGGCPNIEPMPGFEMKKMLGVWYVIQKTSTASSCLTYNFTQTEKPGVYNLEQVSQHFILGLTPLEHQYRYTGELSVPDSSVPARMNVKFPLNPAGSASFTIFMTDYENYAGIFTCQKLAFAHRQSATILSRTKVLDKMYIDKIRARLSASNIDPFEMSIVSQKDCPKPDNKNATNINIDDDTFSTQSIAGVIRKAGEKIGDGFEYVADGAKKIYHKVADSDEMDSKEVNGKIQKSHHPDAEWLP